MKYFFTERKKTLANLASEIFPVPILLLASPTVPAEPATSQKIRIYDNSCSRLGSNTESSEISHKQIYLAWPQAYQPKLLISFEDWPHPSSPALHQACRSCQGRGVSRKLDKDHAYPVGTALTMATAVKNIRWRKQPYNVWKQKISMRNKKYLTEKSSRQCLESNRNSSKISNPRLYICGSICYDLVWPKLQTHSASSKFEDDRGSIIKVHGVDHSARNNLIF